MTGSSKIDAWRKPPARSERNAMSTEVVAEPSVAAVPQPAAAELASAEFIDGPLRPKLAQLTKVSIVIPVYNEEGTIQKLVGLVVNAPLQDGLRREIIIVNDCSKDGTAAKLDELPKLYPQADFNITHKPVNEGKGAALRDGFRKASGDVILIQDADLEYDPRDYLKLLQPLVDDKADVVYGSRFIGEPHRVLYYYHTLGNRFLTMMSNVFTNLNLTDMEVCYTVFRREVIQGITLKSDRFGFEPEVTAKVARFQMPPLDGRPARRCRVYEIPVSYNGRDYNEGKKIGWKDGFQALYCIVRYAFGD